MKSEHSLTKTGSGQGGVHAIIDDVALSGVATEHVPLNTGLHKDSEAAGDALEDFLGAIYPTLTVGFETISRLRSFDNNLISVYIQ